MTIYTNYKKLYRIRLAIFIAMLVALPLAAQAAEAIFNLSELTSLPSSGSKEYTLDADQISYDLASEIVIAEGNVKVRYGDYLIIADNITYDKKHERLEAKNKLLITDPKGNHYMADTVELDRTTNTITALKLKTKVNNQFSITAGLLEKKKDGSYLVEDFSFTACQPCKGSRKLAPLWLIKGWKTVLNKEQDTLKYYDASFELLGVPVLRTPYASMPSPNVKRKTGLLIPSLSFSETLGFRIRVPYYINIAPNMDLTFVPIVATKDYSLYEAEFRHLLISGRYYIKTNFIKADKLTEDWKHIKEESTYGGYLEAKGEFYGGDEALPYIYGFASGILFDRTKTYLKKYDIKKDDILINNFYLQKAGENNNYWSVQALSFQDLRDDSYYDISPRALPLIRMQHNIPVALLYNSNLRLDAHALNLLQSHSPNYRKISLSGKWETPWELKYGHELSLTLGIRGDFYSLDKSTNKEAKHNQTPASKSTPKNIYPDAILEWKWPLYRLSSKMNMHIEPIIQLIANPYQKDLFVPPEQETLMEINSNNLFSSNHYYGLEKVETGHRVNYGLSGSLATRSSQQLWFLIGGSHRLQDVEIDKEDRTTYLSNINLHLSDNFFLSHRTSFNVKNFSLLHSEIDMSLKYTHWNLMLSYIISNKRQSAKLLYMHPQEINANLWCNVYGSWWVNVLGRSKLGSKIENSASKEPYLLEDGVGLSYRNECLDLTFSIKRNHVKLRDIEPSTSYNLTVKAPF